MTFVVYSLDISVYRQTSMVCDRFLTKQKGKLTFLNDNTADNPFNAISSDM